MKKNLLEYILLWSTDYKKLSNNKNLHSKEALHLIWYMGCGYCMHYSGPKLFFLSKWNFCESKINVWKKLSALGSSSLTKSKCLVVRTNVSVSLMIDMQIWSRLGKINWLSFIWIYLGRRKSQIWRNFIDY